MGSICKKPRLVIMSVMLLFSFMLALNGPIVFQGPTYEREMVSIIEQQAILTTESPILFLNLTYATFRVNIVGLETNSTPVSIRAFNPIEFLDIQNVTFIDEIPLIIYSETNRYEWDEWGVILVRENNDVNVSIEAEVWYYNQAIPDLAPPIYIGMYGIPFTFIALFWIGNLERQCRVHKTGENNWDRKQGPLAIIAVILFASVLITPLVSTVSYRSFTQTFHGQRGYTAELTEIYPSIGFDLQEIRESPNSEISVRTFNQEVQFVAEGSNDTISWVITESCSEWNNWGWWLLFEEDISYETLTLSRTSTDSTAEIQVKYSWTQFRFPYDFEVPVGLAVIGFILLPFAFIMAYRIDRLFRQPEAAEMEYYDYDKSG